MSTLLPLPDNTHVKWERWVAFKDDQGSMFVKYSCRHTETPLPEWISADIVPEHNRSFFSASSDEENVTINYITRCWIAPASCLADLVNAVRSGDVPRKREGTSGEMFAGDRPVYAPELINE